MSTKHVVFRYEWSNPFASLVTRLMHIANKLLVNKCVSLVTTEMIQIQCTRSDARPLHELKVNTLDEHQHQLKSTGFDSFLEQQDVHMY